MTKLQDPIKNTLTHLSSFTEICNNLTSQTGPIAANLVAPLNREEEC